MNIVCVSDTHQLERDVLVPPGDLLVHAGDFSMMRMATQRTLRSFNEWLGEQPHRHKVLTCGNHEFEFERDPHLQDQITNGHLLLNSGLEVEGLRIWGSPVTPLAEELSGSLTPRSANGIGLAYRQGRTCCWCMGLLRHSGRRLRDALWRS